MKKRIIAVILVGVLMLCVYGATTPSAGLPNDGHSFLTGEPSGMLMLPDNTMLVCDTFQKVIWLLTEDSAEVLAGRRGVIGLDGIPIGGYNDAEYDDAAFMSPWAISPFLDGYAVTDTENHVVRFIDPHREIIRTAVGTGQPGYADLRGIRAAFNRPTGITTDEGGNIYIADTGNHVIRKVDTNGNVTTFAGTTEGCSDGTRTTAAFREPMGVYWLGGALYVADTGNHRICVIRNGVVTTISGGNTPKTGDAFYEGGNIDGPVASAMFSNPQGLAVDSEGIIYVADTGNGSVRVIDVENGRVRTVSRTSGNVMYPVSPRSLVIHGNILYVGDVFAKTIFTVTIGEKQYDDVTADDWFVEAVNFAFDNRLFTGVSATGFAPDESMTRGMFVTVLTRACLIFEPNTIIRGDSTFADVPPGQYYSNAIAWAADNGLASGIGDGLFDPNAPISRQEMATLLYKFSEVMEFDIYDDGSFDTPSFPDIGDAEPWATQALAWAVANNIFQGNHEGLIQPLETATRAQAAQVFYNYFQQLGW